MPTSLCSIASFRVSVSVVPHSWSDWARDVSSSSARQVVWPKARAFV